MRKYVEFENNIINQVKRGLITQNEAINRIGGYLSAMVDFGILPEDRYSDELRTTTKKILEII